MPLDFRPCGVCRELVPADIGCAHWKPNNRSGKSHGKWPARTPRALGAAAEHRVRLVECTCAKIPGAPHPHLSDCKKTQAAYMLDILPNRRVE